MEGVRGMMVEVWISKPYHVGVFYTLALIEDLIWLLGWRGLVPDVAHFPRFPAQQ